MAILRIDNIREMDGETLQKRFDEIEKEFMMEMTQLRSGGKAQNPGKIRELRHTIAKFKTVIRERELGLKISKVKRTIKPKETKTEKKVEKKTETKEEKPKSETKKTVKKEATKKTTEKN